MVEMGVQKDYYTNEHNRNQMDQAEIMSKIEYWQSPTCLALLQVPIMTREPQYHL
jgi:hypothetical protein